jgi:hypothetical protein
MLHDLPLPSCPSPLLRHHDSLSGSSTPIEIHSPYSSTTSLNDLWIPGSPKAEKVVNNCKNCGFSFRVRTRTPTDFCSKGQDIF